LFKIGHLLADRATFIRDAGVEQETLGESNVAHFLHAHRIESQSTEERPMAESLCLALTLSAVPGMAIPTSLPKMLRPPKRSQLD
jgi:hypothetical protein